MLNRSTLFIIGFALIVSNGLLLLGLDRLTVIGISILCIFGVTYLLDTDDKRSNDE